MGVSNRNGISCGTTIPGSVIVLPVIGTAGSVLDFTGLLGLLEERSRNSGSWREVAELSDSLATCCGLAAGETTGDVCKDSGTLLLVSNTKNASPPSPSFIA